MYLYANYVVNGVTVEANQVWTTKSGNLALIVDAPECYPKFDCGLHSMGLAMLWYDDIDRRFTVSEICDRLDVLQRQLDYVGWLTMMMCRGAQLALND